MNLLLNRTISLGSIVGIMPVMAAAHLFNASGVVDHLIRDDSAIANQPAPLSIAPTASPSVAQASAQKVYEQAVQQHESGDLKAAVQSYRQAIRLNPKLDTAYINLGLVLIELKQLDAAKQILQQVLRLPDRLETPASIHTLAHYNLAIIFNRQRERPFAIAEVQKALAITPNFAIAQELLQQLKNLAIK